LTFEVNPGTSTGHIKPNLEWEGEIIAVVSLSDPDADWQKPISEYLRLGTIPDDETETQHLARWAKGYLIHNDELYHHSISGILH
jgi:hypothetical protein